MSALLQLVSDNIAKTKFDSIVNPSFPSFRAMITGSTTWTDAKALRRELSQLPVGSVIVTGDTQGVDAIAITVATELGFSVEAMHKTEEDHLRYPDDPWKGLNDRMLETGIDLVFAFHADYGKSGMARGTKHAVELARQAEIEVRIFLA